MNFTVDQNDKSGLLCMDGDLTIVRAGEIRQMLIKALESVSDLTVDHSKAEQADLSYLQMLISAVRSARSLGKNLSIKISPVPGSSGNDVLAGLINDLGITEINSLIKG